MFNRLRNIFTKKTPTTPTVAPTEDRGTDRLTKEETAKFEEAEKKETDRKAKEKDLVSWEDANAWQKRYGDWRGGKKSKSKKSKKRKTKKSKKRK